MTLRLALVSNYREEASPSMLVCGDNLYQGLTQEYPEVTTTRIQPAYIYRWQRLPWLGKMRFASGLDKMLNRFWDYPHHVQQQVSQHHLFHICDQSYSSLIHHLSAERTGIFCHDLDVFRSLLQPKEYPRSVRYNTMQRHVLNGFKKAAIVFYTTEWVRQEILHHGLIDPDRLVQVPLGIGSFFSPTVSNPTMAATLKKLVGNRPFLLNVSVNLPRKRLDVLLNTYARLRPHFPDLLLLRVGPEWLPEYQDQIRHLGIEEGICLIPFLEQQDLAEVYRQAKLVLITSEAEGFGMPLVEALACGAVVVASDISVLQEVGGQAGIYCRVGDPKDWADRVTYLLHHPEAAPPLSQRMQQIMPYTWSNHARTILEAYQDRIPEISRVSRISTNEINEIKDLEDSVATIS